MIGIAVSRPRVATALRRVAAVAGVRGPNSATTSQSDSNDTAYGEATTGDHLPSLVAGLTWADTVEIIRIIS